MSLRLLLIISEINDMTDSDKTQINIKGLFEKFNTKSNYVKSEYLAEGEENIIFKVYTTDKEYVIRISKFPRSLDDSRFEAEFTRHLYSQGISIPKQYPTLDSKPVHIDIEDKSYTLSEYVAGSELEQFESIHLVQIAKLMRKMHKASNSFESLFDRLTSTDHLSWLTDTDDTVLNNSKGDNATKEQFFNIYKVHSQIIQKNIRKLPKYALHNDIHKGNLLFKSNKLTAVIDFDECHKHYIPLELGWSIKEMCLSDIKGEFTKRIRIFLDEYNKEELLTELDKQIMFSTMLAEFSRGYLRDPDEPEFTEGAIANILEIADIYPDILT